MNVYQTIGFVLLMAVCLIGSVYAIIELRRNNRKDYEDRDTIVAR